MSKYGLATTVGVFLLLAALHFAVPVSASPAMASFSGNATVHLVGKDAGGNVVNMRLTDVPFAVVVTDGGPGVGTITLTILGLTLGPDPVGVGQIKVTDKARGGGTLDNPVTGYMSQFGFGVTRNGGQFQCQNTGRSAAVVSPFMGLTVLQMDVHGTVQADSVVIT